MRNKLSQQHIKGNGIEIGALHCPTTLFNGAKAQYVDLMPTSDLQQKFPEVQVSETAPIIDNAEELSKFADESQDFVIANHVFEHCENPILTFKNWLRVLKPEGIIFAGLPNKEQCFDRPRSVTTLNHIIRDYVHGPDISLEYHYYDWYKNSELEKKTGQDLLDSVAAAVRARSNIHFHVWDEAAYRVMFSFFAEIFTVSWELHRNGSELILICRK